MTKGVPQNMDTKAKSILKAELMSCDHHLENSMISSSPKDTLEKSVLISQNRELIFNPDEDILPNSPPMAGNIAEFGTISKIFGTGVTDDKSTDSVAKLFTPRRTNRLTKRRNTETEDRCRKAVFRKKTELTSENSDTLFNHEELQKPINPKELFNTISAVEAKDSKPKKVRIF